MFAPGARPNDINKHMEATIGFGTRGLPGEPASPASKPPAHVPDAPRIDRAPHVDPTPPAPVQASSPPGSAPQGIGDGTPLLAAPGSPQVTGTLKKPNGDPLVGSHLCLADTTIYTNCLYYATTTAGGAFAIPAADGSYLLRGWDDSGIYLPVFWSSAGSKLYKEDAEVITLAGSDRTGIVFTLPVYPLVKGKVTDGVGAALEGMYITSSGYPTDNVVTDASGNYAVKVWPGVSTTIMLNSNLKYRFAWYSTGGTVLDQTLASSIPVNWTDVTGINLTPTPWPKVTGRLTDKNGAGIPFLQVVASRTNQQITTSTDANGYYSLYLYQAGSGWSVGAGGVDPWIGNSANVAADVDATVNLTMHRYPHVAGTIVNSNGDPIAGVTVAALEQYGRTGVTDADGKVNYVFYEYQTYKASVRYSDPTQTYVSGWLGPSGFTDLGANAGAGFTLVPDQVLDVSVTLPRYANLTGHLRYADGSPVPNTSLAPTRPGGYQTSGMTDGSGAFSIKVVPDSYHVWIAGGWYGSEGFGYYEGAVKAFPVGESGASIEMYLPPTSTISGKVTSGSTALSGIEVDIYLAGSPYTYVSTAADGTWHVNLPPGRYQVGFYDGSIAHGHGWYRAAGYTSDPSLADLVSVGAGATTTGINVSLPAIRHISGTVVDLTTTTTKISQPVVEAFVNGVYYSQVLGSTGGAYSLPVAPGAVTLWIYDPNLIHAPGWRTSTGLSADWALAAPTTVGTTDITGVTIKTPEAGLLKLTIPGQANAEADVNGGATSFAQRQTNGDLLMPLIKGSYKIWIEYDTPTLTQLPGWVKGSTLTPDVAQATLKSVTTTSATLTVTMPTGGQMSGWARAGQNVDVVLYANGSPYLEELAGSGAFTFTVPLGTYRLGFVDPFSHFTTGYLGPSGFVTTYAAAKDIVLTASGVSDLNLDLPLGAPPASPTGVTAVPYNTSAGVSFAPPATTPDRPFTHFAVTASPGGRQCITVTTSCIVTGLTNGTAYTFRVTASTITGYSAPSAASNSTTPKPVPNAPFGQSAVSTAHDVQVSWVAPANNGSAITGYLATAQPGGATCTPSPATQTTCTIHGLADGRYTISITAANALGSGPPATVAALVDTTAPTVTGPTVTLRSGVVMSGSSIPVTIAWTATDALSGVADTSLEVALGTGAFSARTLSSMTATSYSGTLAASSSAYSFRDQALDVFGNLSPWVLGSTRILAIKQQNGTGVTYSGTWYTVSTTSALGGSAKYTTGKNSVSYTFTGRGISFVTRKGTNAGTAYVYIDGVKVATLSMYASTTSYRWVAFTKGWSTSASHTIKVVNAATSGHNRLYVDAFLTIK